MICRLLRLAAQESNTLTDRESPFSKSCLYQESPAISASLFSLLLGAVAQAFFFSTASLYLISA